MQRWLSIVVLLIACNEQRADMSFDTSVTHPTHTTAHPKVLFDEAHRNFHTTHGRYAPLVNLLRNDGYLIEPNPHPFTEESLRGYSILIISNAMGREDKYAPALEDREIDAVESWVRGGGSLLLVADHYPMGSAVESLSRRFGVDMGKGYVIDSIHYEGPDAWKDQLVFSKDNGLLGRHPILAGRHDSERVQRVVTFTGQSLKGTSDAANLLVLASSAMESIPDSIWKDGNKTFTRFTDPQPVGGRAQGVAVEFGLGRVVVLGEAAMITAQISEGEKFGMNTPGNDNRLFTLNIMRWLSRVL